MNTKNPMRTYIQGDITQTQQETVRSHMDYLGFGSTANPGEFAAGGSVNEIAAIRDILSDSSQLPMHSHSFMEFFQYVSDSRIEYLIGTHRYRLRQGDIVCIPPGTCHQVLHYEPRDTPCVRNLIAVGPAFLEQAGWHGSAEQFILWRTSDSQQAWLRILFDTCIQEQQCREHQWQNVLKGCIYILMAQLTRNPGTPIVAEQDGLFENILNYINSNLEQKLTLADTAKHFFVSERTITRVFQKNLGKSFYRYVTQLRLLTAKNLILSEDIPLEEVCRRVGFEEYPTFYRAFRKEYGISPRQMRRPEHSREL